jgi:hypothetical protein
MVLKIAYTKLAVIGETLQRILYDSVSNSLALTKVSTLSVARTSGGKINQSQVQLNKKISEIEKENLAQIIIHNGFFETDVFYPPDLTESQQTLFVLSVVLDSRLHTVVWTDASKNVPTYLNKVIESLQELN